MANPIGGVTNALQAAPVSQNSQANQTPKQNAQNTGAPQDTVTISNAGRAASQAQAPKQNQQAAADTGQKGK